MRSSLADADRLHLLDLTPAELAPALAAWGEPAYRAQSILEWAFRRRARCFEAMTDLGKPLRTRLSEAWDIRTARLVASSIAPGGTTKILLEWADGATTESVMIPAPRGRRRTACVSTQVGCGVGCRFCASGLGGVVRNLTVGEILEQALVLNDLLAEREEALTHVVFMGMGEPLANFRNTVAAVRRLNAPWGLGIGQRRITVSTVGLPKQIERLAAERLQVTLALSLHAVTDELRRELIPWAETLSVAELVRACKLYFETTGREVTLEYCLLGDVNDGPADAAGLARIARELRAHVNLMLHNSVAGLDFARPDRARAHAFLEILRGRGVNVHLRESRGLDNDAACGQLRRLMRGGDSGSRSTVPAADRTIEAS